MFVSTIFVCFGVFFVGYGVWHTRRALAVRRDGVRCDGYVVGREAGAAGGGLFPVIEYTTADSHRLRFTSKIHSPASLLPMKKRVPVRYSAANKANAVIDTFIGTWGQGVGSLLLGVAFLVLAPFAPG